MLANRIQRMAIVGMGEIWNGPGYVYQIQDVDVEYVPEEFIMIFAQCPFETDAEFEKWMDEVVGKLNENLQRRLLFNLD